MSDRLAEFGDDVEVALITFTSVEKLTAYVADKNLPFPVVLDRDRSSYRSYGLGRGTVRRVWSPKALKKYVEILRKDGLGALSRTDEDTLQLGGDFVVGPDGTLVYGFWGEGPDDRPTVDELVAAVTQN